MVDSIYWTEEQIAEIQRIMRLTMESAPVRMETSDQVPVGVMSYAFGSPKPIIYAAGNTLPITTTFEIVHGRRVMLFHSGSGYHATGVSLIGTDAAIDGVTVSSPRIYANPAFTHLAFVPAFTDVSGLARGTHTLVLSAITGTGQDANDVHQVVLFESP